MNRYVVGFAGSISLSTVALIQKTRPKWQEGKWNGIGGKIEPGEAPLAAMRREWNEETLLKLDPFVSWIHFATIRGGSYHDSFELWCFTLGMGLENHLDIPLKVMENYGTDEVVEIVPRDVITGLKRPMVYNIPMLIDLAFAVKFLRHPVVDIYERG